MPAGPLCHACRPLSVMPAGPPLSCPPASLCHACRPLSVMPAGPPLSFPPVSPITNVGDKVSGNPVSCFVVLLFVWACMEESHGFPIENVGNDRMPALAPLSCPPVLSVMPAGPPLSCPPVVSGNPGSCFVVLLFVWACMGEDLDSRLKMSGMTEGELKAGGMTEGLLWPSLSCPPGFSVIPAGFPDNKRRGQG